MPDLDTVYRPGEVEARWSRAWLDRGWFRADARSPASSSYCIVIPPPNITGALHLGHALNNTLQDILIRWHRMRGDATLWQPGTDHAGIATQNVVERQLLAEVHRSS
jgi:valyl-tRNA synthetase